MILLRYYNEIINFTHKKNDYKNILIIFLNSFIINIIKYKVEI